MNDTTRQRIIEILTTPPNNGDTHTMEFISDSAHGWLKVPVSDYKIAEAPASSHSYYDGDPTGTLDSAEFVYLEEDMDAPRFLKAVGIHKRPDGGDEYERETEKGFIYRRRTLALTGGTSWYIPERHLASQRRYNELSPRDMNRIHDPAYVNPFAAETPNLIEVAQQSGHLQIIDYR